MVFGLPFMGAGVVGALVANGTIRMTFTLRCVEEHAETYRTSNSSSTRVRCDQLWADAIVLERGGAFYDDAFPLAFKLPDGTGTRKVAAKSRPGVSALTSSSQYRRASLWGVPPETLPRG